LLDGTLLTVARYVATCGPRPWHMFGLFLCFCLGGKTRVDLFAEAQDGKRKVMGLPVYHICCYRFVFCPRKQGRSLLLVSIFIAFVREKMGMENKERHVPLTCCGRRHF
jgi:hypothetical protein